MKRIRSRDKIGEAPVYIIKKNLKLKKKKKKKKNIHTHTLYQKKFIWVTKLKQCPPKKNLLRQHSEYGFKYFF